VVALPLIASAVYVPTALALPLDAATATVMTPAAVALTPSALDFPGYGASAVGVVGGVDVDTADGVDGVIGADGVDGVLATSGSAEALPIASISKVITALVVLEEKPLAEGEAGPTIEFTAADAALYSKYLAVGGKVEPVNAGFRLTERELLDVVLVASANNYAESLAGWAFGSQEAFTAAAASWLDSHGLDSTTLVEPTGMSPSNVSTASDLVRLGALALADPTVSSIVRQTSITMPTVGVVENTNELLGISGVDGIKTGTLDEAGACLLFSADYPVGDTTVTVVGVVLGGVDHPSLDREVLSLLSTVDRGFQQVTLVTEGDPLADYRTEWGETATAVAARTSSVVVWADTAVSAAVATEPVTTAAAGSPVGTVRFSVGDTVIEVPLVLADGIAEPGAGWRIRHPLGLD
jgi:D-alanyl-D-alanine carboxypeptidase (penicillin-binding protein 5/6)